MPRTKLRQCEEHLRYCLWVITKNAGLTIGKYLDSEHEQATRFLLAQDVDRHPLVEENKVTPIKPIPSTGCSLEGCKEKGVWSIGTVRYCYPHYIEAKR